MTTEINFKTLRPFLHQWLPRYMHVKYPKYVQLCDRFLRFLEEKNSLEWYIGNPTIEAENSIYQNAADFTKHYRIEDLPYSNMDVLNAYVNNFLKNLDIRSSYIDMDPPEMRSMAQYSTFVHNKTGSSSSFNLFFSLIHRFLLGSSWNDIDASVINNSSTRLDTTPEYFLKLTVSVATAYDVGSTVYGQTSGAYSEIKYVDDDQLYLDNVFGTYTVGETLTIGSGTNVVASIDTANYINENEVIISEVPAYSLSFNDDIIDVLPSAVTNEMKGKNPFKYQIVSKSPIFENGKFIDILKNSLNPAGFVCEIFYLPDDMVSNIYVDSMNHIKRVIDVGVGINFFTDDNGFIIVDENNESFYEIII